LIKHTFRYLKFLDSSKVTRNVAPFTIYFLLFPLPRQISKSVEQTSGGKKSPFECFLVTFGPAIPKHRGQLAHVAALSFSNYLVGVTLLDELEAGPVPILFLAVTVNV
jgi:hypothetical protein